MAFGLHKPTIFDTDAISNALQSTNAGVAFVFGGEDGVVATDYTTVEQYIFATPATKGAMPISLAYGLAAASAASNATVAFIFCGQKDNVSGDFNHQYIFASPGTRGATPVATATGKSKTCAASNATDAFLFGGHQGAGADLDTVENYIFAVPSSKGASPTSLTQPRTRASACGNSTMAFMFGGEFMTAGAMPIGATADCDIYLFTKPGTRGSGAAALNSARRLTSAASNATNAFVFGGGATASATYYTTVENYLYATPGTKGTVPASLSSADRADSAASSATNAFTFGTASICENYQFNVPGTKGAAPANLSNNRSNHCAASSRYYIS
jgi:hypothetical protein